MDVECMGFLLFGAEGLELVGKEGEEGMVIGDQTRISRYKIDQDWG